MTGESIDLPHQYGKSEVKTQTSLKRTPAMWSDDNRLKTLANKDAACPSGQRVGLGICRHHVQIQILL